MKYANVANNGRTKECTILVHAVAAARRNAWHTLHQRPKFDFDNPGNPSAQTLTKKKKNRRKFDVRNENNGFSIIPKAD